MVNIILVYKDFWLRIITVAMGIDAFVMAIFWLIGIIQWYFDREDLADKTSAPIVAFTLALEVTFFSILLIGEALLTLLEVYV